MPFVKPTLLTHHMLSLARFGVDHEPSVRLFTRIKNSVAWLARRSVYKLWDCVRQFLQFVSTVAVSLQLVDAPRNWIRQVNIRVVVVDVGVCFHWRFVLLNPSRFSSHWINSDERAGKSWQHQQWLFASWNLSTIMLKNQSQLKIYKNCMLTLTGTVSPNDEDILSTSTSSKSLWTFILFIYFTIITILCIFKLYTSNSLIFIIRLETELKRTSFMNDKSAEADFQNFISKRKLKTITKIFRSFHLNNFI